MNYVHPLTFPINAIIFFSLALVSSAAFTGFGGLTFETCRSNADCKGNRTCFTIQSETVALCSPTSTSCFCRPVSLPECTSSSQCDEGEVCFGVSRNVCSSCSNVARIYPGVGTLVDDLSRCAGLGVTGDSCKSADGCASPRICAELDPFTTCSLGNKPCYCLPKSGLLTGCTSCEDCASGQGEGCFKEPTASPICLTEARFKYSSIYSRVGSECATVPSPPTTPSPSQGPTITPAPAFSSTSPTAYPTVSMPLPSLSSPSASASSFPSVVVGTGPPNSPSASASSFPSVVALPDISNSPSASASSFPSVVALPDISNSPSASTSPFPTVDAATDPSISPSASSTPSSSVSLAASQSIFPSVTSAPSSATPVATPEPCIAVQHLTHLSPADLVFHAHRLAAVLCDAFGSCATAGHIVVFDGHAMRMTRYCALQDVQCVERRMLVNNPRMRRGRRVKSMTKGLEFSVFAARYESWVEETILRVVVAVGM